MESPLRLTAEGYHRLPALVIPSFTHSIITIPVNDIHALSEMAQSYHHLIHCHPCWGIPLSLLFCRAWRVSLDTLGWKRRVQPRESVPGVLSNERRRLIGYNDRSRRPRKLCRVSADSTAEMKESVSKMPFVWVQGAGRRRYQGLDEN